MSELDESYAEMARIAQAREAAVRAGVEKLRAERDAAREALQRLADDAEYLAMRYADTLAGQPVRDADEALCHVEVAVAAARAALAPEEQA